MKLFILLDFELWPEVTTGGLQVLSLSMTSQEGEKEKISFTRKITQCHLFNSLFFCVYTSKMFFCNGHKRFGKHFLYLFSHLMAYFAYFPHFWKSISSWMKLWKIVHPWFVIDMFRSTYNHLSSWLTDARNLTNPNTVSKFSLIS